MQLGVSCPHILVDFPPPHHLSAVRDSAESLEGHESKLCLCHEVKSNFRHAAVVQFRKHTKRWLWSSTSPCSCHLLSFVNVLTLSLGCRSYWRQSDGLSNGLSVHKSSQAILFPFALMNLTYETWIPLLLFVTLFVSCRGGWGFLYGAFLWHVVPSCSVKKCWYLMCESPSQHAGQWMITMEKGTEQLETRFRIHA